MDSLNKLVHIHRSPVKYTVCIPSEANKHVKFIFPSWNMNHCLFFARSLFFHAGETADSSRQLWTSAGRLQRSALNAHLDRHPAPPWASLLLRVGSKVESQNTEMKWGRETGGEGRDGGIEEKERRGARGKKGNTLVSKLTFNRKTEKKMTCSATLRFTTWWCNLTV